MKKVKLVKKVALKLVKGGRGRGPGPIKLSGRPLTPQEEAFAMLPARAKCPHCVKTRTAAEFGVRVVARDGRGHPTKVIRQSWCVHCRNGTYKRVAKPARAARVARMVRKASASPAKRSKVVARGKTVLIAIPTAQTVKNGHGDNIQYAGLERQTHVFRFATEKELAKWLKQAPAGRVPIEQPVIH